MQKPKTTMVSLEDIIVDTKFQVRKGIKDYWVSTLAELLRAGKPFADNIVLNQDHKLIAGFNRTEAYKKVLAPDAKVPAEIIHFKSDKEAYLYALETNAHGLPLDPYEKKLVRAKLINEYGMDDSAIGGILGISPDRLKKWDADVVHVWTGKKKDPVKTAPLKHGHAHMRGTTITPEQHQQMHDSHLGTSTRFHINKIVARIVDGTIEGDDETTEALQLLREHIETHLEAKGIAV